MEQASQDQFGLKAGSSYFSRDPDSYREQKPRLTNAVGQA